MARNEQATDRWSKGGSMKVFRSLATLVLVASPAFVALGCAAEAGDSDDVDPAAVGIDNGARAADGDALAGDEDSDGSGVARDAMWGYGPGLGVGLGYGAGYGLGYGAGYGLGYGAGYGLGYGYSSGSGYQCINGLCGGYAY